MKRAGIAGLVIAVLLMTFALPAGAGSRKEAPDNKKIRVNVLLNEDITPRLIGELEAYGAIRDSLHSIDAVFMQTTVGNVDDIEALPFVESVSPDAERNGSPVDTVTATDFANGLSTWNLDVINVTELGSPSRKVDLDGTGVYVAVLDTGLLDTWRQYFPEERIATEYAMTFGGGGGEVGNVSTQPNKWEHDTNSHGTHVTSTILGYSLRGTSVNGVAPMATVIPVKVLNNNGSGWSSVVAAGITYVGDLKAETLRDSPVVINMSLGGPVLDAVEKAAIDYAIEKGVIIVASAGNSGQDGMGYPGAYEPVISVAASGWIGEWATGNWWYGLDVPDPQNPADYYITDFSSRQLAGQDLDVAAPGSWVVGPYQLQRGKTSYYFLGGTSMASPHVAGIAALMAQKKFSLTAAEAETILVATALPMPDGCVTDPYDGTTPICWGPTHDETDRISAAGAGIAQADAALDAIP